MGQYTQQQIDAAIQDAQFAFWAEIVKHFPNVTTGDFPPDADMKFEEDCTAALKTWLSYNDPDEEDESKLLTWD